VKKFVILHQGYVTPTEEIKKAWMGWFAAIGDSIVDSGNPFSEGRELTSDGWSDLPLGLDSYTGYTIVEAEDMDAAVKLLDGYPMITGARVYEASAM
jgi:hypothetical protein